MHPLGGLARRYGRVNAGPSNKVGISGGIRAKGLFMVGSFSGGMS
jgi:hypothetical protein